MRFEFDAAKSAANKTKHGIDFVEAQALWNDPDRVEGPGRSTDEPRFQVVGQIGDAIWTATVTYRHMSIGRRLVVPAARFSVSTSTSLSTCCVRSIGKPGASASRVRPLSS